MPACASGNMISFDCVTPPESRSHSASPKRPSSPLSSPSPPPSLVSKLKRLNSELSTSAELLTCETTSSPRVLPRHRSPVPSTSHKINEVPAQENSTLSEFLLALPTRIILWYLNIILGIIRSLYETVLFVIRVPALWASAWLCLLPVILRIPLTLLKWFLTFLYTPTSELTRNKRCVLISGGSTVQAVHLARNFYQAGARVVICEVEGLFNLARYSTTCSKFYTLPKPVPGNIADYVKALKDIVEKERAVYYIPVSAANAAYYDALAKPHLELAGCECFVPNATEVTALDDPLELIRRCRLLGLTTPVHYILRSAEDVSALYANGNLHSGRHLMLAAGPAGMRDRAKVQLPVSLAEFRSLRQEISDKRPWIVIRDSGGPQFITCTTVKDSRVVANVTCRIDGTKGLIPEARADVAQWLDRFFARTFGSKITGHLSFRFVISNDEVVTIGCRIGIGMPYVCLTSVHARLVWRPCRHFSRQHSGPLVVGEAYDRREGFPSAVKQAERSKTNARDNAIDKREALFVYWDPLPYCAYYHLQLPLLRVAGAIRAQHNPPLAVVQ